MPDFETCLERKANFLLLGRTDRRIDAISAEHFTLHTRLISQVAQEDTNASRDGI